MQAVMARDVLDALTRASPQAHVDDLALCQLRARMALATEVSRTALGLTVAVIHAVRAGEQMRRIAAASVIACMTYSRRALSCRKQQRDLMRAHVAPGIVQLAVASVGQRANPRPAFIRPASINAPPEIIGCIVSRHVPHIAYLPGPCKLRAIPVALQYQAFKRDLAANFLLDLVAVLLRQNLGHDPFARVNL